ncbi:MAG: hypothetical protein U1F36_16585 [Planctomycetota bacterium]
MSAALISGATRQILFETGFVVCDVLGLALGAWLLWRRGPRAAGLGRDVRVATVFGLSWVAATALLFTALARSFFGGIAATVHALLFVVAPLTFLRGASRLVVARRVDGLVGVLVGCVIVGVHAWAHFVEPYRLAVDTHHIVTPHAARLPQPVRVALLADIQTDHIGAWEEGVFARAAAARPDLLLFAGDYVQIADRARFAVECAAFRRLIGEFRPKPRLGMFAVIGDIDPDPSIFAGTEVRLLRDETVGFDLAPKLRLCGLDLASSRSPLTADFAARTAAFDGFTIVLGHAPDFAIPVIEGSISIDALLLAGHTHGGQVVIPGFGPPSTLSSVPRAVAAGGLHRYGDACLCVSRGIGMERGIAPRVRLFCPPQLLLFEIGPDS